MEAVTAYKSLDGKFYETEELCYNADFMYEIGKFIEQISTSYCGIYAPIERFLKELIKDNSLFLKWAEITEKYSKYK